MARSVSATHCIDSMPSADLAGLHENPQGHSWVAWQAPPVCGQAKAWTFPEYLK